MTSLRQNIDLAIIGDGRSKSQLVELQAKNHDTTLISLINNKRNTISNQFIPNNSTINGSRRTKPSKPNKSSFVEHNNLSIAS